MNMQSTRFLLTLMCVLSISSISLYGQALIDFESDSALIGGVVVVNDAYSLPTDAGLSGQVLTTDGSGESEWMSLSAPDEEIGTYVYMTPYVCGAQGTTPFPASGDRNDGQYQTSISIINPAHGVAAVTRHVTHTHEAIDSLIPPDSVRGPEPISITKSLPRFYTYAMTCDQIYDMLGYTPHPGTPIFEGNVIFESDEKIAVSATYTYYDVDAFIEVVNQGGAGGLGLGNSIDIEQIVPIFVSSPPVE